MSKRPTRLTLLRVGSALLVISAVGAIAAYTLNRPAVPVADRAWPKLEQATGVDADQIPLLLKQAAGIDANRTSLKLEQATGIDAPPALLRDFNVLLITMDTTRADHLHAYGHTGVETPHLDSLAQGGFSSRTRSRLHRRPFPRTVRFTPGSTPIITVRARTAPFASPMMSRRSPRPSRTPAIKPVR